jgi:hypothetical protein
MKTISFTLKSVALLAFLLALPSIANAQATRTWVSGVGDDANPCSRTAPCKTFAGAISKTADAGEIDAIDPGGFGAVTITKSITIDGQGTMASILAAGTNGVNVNDSASGAPNTHIVTIRNISINGAGSGLVGINFTSAKVLHVESCEIFGFRAGNGRGISMSTTAGDTHLEVQDTTIHDNSGDGIFMSDTVFPGVANIIRTVSKRNANGYHAQNNMRVTLVDSFGQENTTAGVLADGTVNTEVNVLRSEMAHNNAGIQSTNASNRVRVATSFIVNNSAGFSTTAGGLIDTGQDNVFVGNPTPGAATGTFGKA